MHNHSRSCFIFMGGPGPDNSLNLTWDVDLIVAADSGYHLCKNLGYAPHVLIGDMDSISQETFVAISSDIEVHSFERDKDKTDTELCLEYVKKRNYKDISIVGSSSERIDHFIGLLYLFYGNLAPNRFITQQYHIEYIADTTASYRFNVENGSMFSLFPLPFNQTKANSKGLKWELDNYTLHNGFTSLSNECNSTNNSVEVSLQEGTLLVVWKHNNYVQRPTILL